MFLGAVHIITPVIGFIRLTRTSCMHILHLRGGAFRPVAILQAPLAHPTTSTFAFYSGWRVANVDQTTRLWQEMHYNKIWQQFYHFHNQFLSFRLIITSLNTPQQCTHLCLEIKLWRIKSFQEIKSSPRQEYAKKNYLSCENMGLL